MGNLGDRYAKGALSTDQPLQRGTPLWVCEFPVSDLPRDTDFEMYHGSIKGPGGYILVYLDEKQYGAGDNGKINEYAPRSAAMYVRKGQRIRIVWSIGTGTFPEAWIWLRTPEVGRI